MGSARRKNVPPARKEGPKTEDERRAWLEEKHKLGTNYAWWIAGYCDGKGLEDGDPE